MTLDERLQELGLTKHQREIAASKKPEDVEHLLWKVSENASITNAAAYIVRSLKNLEAVADKESAEDVQYASLPPEEPVAPLTNNELKELIATVPAPWNERFKAMLEQRKEKA